MIGVATGADSGDNTLPGTTEQVSAMGILKLTAVAAISSLLLAGCAQEEKPDGVIPEGYKSALDKAQGVEGKLEDAMQQQGRAIDESEQ
jgi:outer membrane murein-binding lipoprotein Lpp